jgi:hypothetical protein
VPANGGDVVRTGQRGGRHGLGVGPNAPLAFVTESCLSAVSKKVSTASLAPNALPLTLTVPLG